MYPFQQLLFFPPFKNLFYPIVWEVSSILSSKSSTSNEFVILILVFFSFTDGSAGKDSQDAGAVGLIPGSGRSLGGEIETYSSTLVWKIPWLYRGAWWAPIHGSMINTFKTWSLFLFHELSIFAFSLGILWFKTCSYLLFLLPLSLCLCVLDTNTCLLISSAI